MKYFLLLVSILNGVFLLAQETTLASKRSSLQPGYYFWIFPELKGYAARGHGGQFLLLVPEKKLVVVYTALPYTSGDFFDDDSELMKLIVESCY